MSDGLLSIFIQPIVNATVPGVEKTRRTLSSTSAEDGPRPSCSPAAGWDWCSRAATPLVFRNDPSSQSTKSSMCDPRSRKRPPPPTLASSRQLLVLPLEEEGAGRVQLRRTSVMVPSCTRQGGKCRGRRGSGVTHTHQCSPSIHPQLHPVNHPPTFPSCSRRRTASNFGRWRL